MANSTSLKVLNLTTILKTVRAHPQISKPDIARMTGLTCVTVNSLVGELVNSGHLSETGTAISSGGRKAQLYKLNSRSSYIVGVNLRETDSFIGLFDLDGNIIFANAFPISKYTSVESTLEAISSSITELLGSANVDLDGILGISIISPGIVDNSTGIIKSIPKLPQWTNVPICDILSGKFDIPAVITRDTDAAVSYLKWISPDDRHDILFISIDEGIGSGAYFSSGLFRGSHGFAGELGHTTVDLSGPVCSCGNRGCLELYANNHAIISKYEELSSAAGLKPLFHTDDSYVKEKYSILKLVDLVSSGNQPADKAFRQAIEYIAVLLVNALRSYDVSEIIIECPWLAYSSSYFNKLVSEVYQRTPYLSRTDLKIHLNSVENIFTKASFVPVANMIFEPGVISDKFLKLEKRL